jgi:hypothetical protein
MSFPAIAFFDPSLWIKFAITAMVVRERWFAPAPMFAALRESASGPSLHSPQCSIIPAFEAIAVTVSLQIAAGNPADAPETPPRRASDLGCM